MLSNCDEQLIFNEQYYYADPLTPYYSGEGFTCSDSFDNCDCSNPDLYIAHGVPVPSHLLTNE